MVKYIELWITVRIVEGNLLDRFVVIIYLTTIQVFHSHLANNFLHRNYFMTASDSPSPTNPLNSEDIDKLTAIGKGNKSLRAILCTLARRGLAFRQSHPERAKAILEALSTYPLYKGGQFLFDLMEWEDFMLDGTPPEIVPLDFLGTLPESLSNLFKALGNYLNPASYDDLTDPQPDEDSLSATERQLPILESSFYLYQEVILGWFSSLPANRSSPPPSQPVLPEET
ncbi:MAG: hypothetical protein SWJ54_18940 [Cyanobacteriota bacterium]|nr:hypothetical protein [Cyanobacteriota bacterium]